MELNNRIENRDSPPINGEIIREFLLFMAGRKDVSNSDPNRLYITGVPKDVSDIAFINYLIDIRCPKPLNRVRLNRGYLKNGNESLYAYTFLEYDNPQDASDALSLLHLQRPYLLRVVYARRREDKQQNELNVKVKTGVQWHKKTDGRIAKLTKAIKDKSSYSDFCELSSKKSTDSGVSDESGDRDSMSPSSNSSSEHSDSTTDSSGNQDSIEEYKRTKMPTWDRDIPLSFMELLTTGELVRLLPTANAVCGTCSKSPFVDHIHFILDEQIIVNPVESLPPLKNGCCNQCGNKSKIAFQYCSACERVMYCSDACQILHWRCHINECLKIRR
ncbi:hypothetical protein B4U80_11678 [Leptotrombidium deliense]|uniref:MYND-type domain-containing protein n=1 Tax=Leptotrombidium deliense TaxID=299467 RepID=A0A443S3T8_9ACAR|nr:hypothetical protein B4U80_11678 [Leptotrombidium deliense]